MNSKNRSDEHTVAASRVCTKCHIEKEAAQFHKCYITKSGLAASCKDCVRKTARCRQDIRRDFTMSIKKQLNQGLELNYQESRAAADNVGKCQYCGSVSVGNICDKCDNYRKNLHPYVKCNRCHEVKPVTEYSPSRKICHACAKAQYAAECERNAVEEPEDIDEEANREPEGLRVFPPVTFTTSLDPIAPKEVEMAVATAEIRDALARKPDEEEEP